tara:strand:+ start:18 stop:551 length:534 start_codon:yes stop_codon:yes gene_type:complete
MAQEAPRDMTLSHLKINPPSTGNNQPVLEVAGPVSVRNGVVTNGAAAVVLTENQSGYVCLFDTAGASSFTLPAPKAGLVFTFITTVTATADHVIKTNTLNTDGFLGGVVACSTGGSADSFSADADGSNDHITLNGSTTGGLAGTMIKCVAVDTENWAVSGNVVSSGTSATCFGDAQL